MEAVVTQVRLLESNFNVSNQCWSAMSECIVHIISISDGIRKPTRGHENFILVKY